MRRFWTKAEDERLRKLYPKWPDAKVGERLNRSAPGVSARAVILGLHKSDAFKVKYSRRFVKGFKPWNAGLKGVNGFSATRFRKGNKPQTLKPIGSEKLKWGVLYRKVADTRNRRKDWRAVHVMEWERIHGRKVPRGKLIVFADRNQANFAPENLICITRGENMLRNSYHRFPQPIPKLIQLRGALNRQINRRLHAQHRHA